MPDDRGDEYRMTVLFRGPEGLALSRRIREHLQARHPEDWYRRQSDWMREAAEEKLAREGEV